MESLPLELIASGILSRLSQNTVEFLKHVMTDIDIEKAMTTREYWRAKLENLLGLHIPDHLVLINI